MVIEVIEIQSSVSFEYVLIRIPYNVGELTSCLRVHMAPILVECPPSNGGSLLLYGTMMVWYRGVYVSFWVGDDDIVLILFDLLI